MSPNNNNNNNNNDKGVSSNTTTSTTNTTGSNDNTSTIVTANTITSNTATASITTAGATESSSLPLPPGWTKGFSKSQQRTYYCHAVSKHTQWHFPTATEAHNPRLAKKRIREAHAVATTSTSGTATTGGGTMTNRSGVSDDSLLLGDIVGAIVPKVVDASEQKRPRVSSSSRYQSKDTGSTTATTTTSSSSSTNAAGNKKSIDSDATCVAIIVPYRDIHAAQNRAKHLQQFVPYMQEFLQKQVQKGTLIDYHIYIVEQSNDNRKFNRGKLLNIGFDIARKNKCRNPSDPKHDVFIFHDVDLLPGDDLGSSYTKFPTVPLHIARVWDRYSNNPKYFGGIVSFSESDMKRINGYPNTFWGWGGEDDEMQKRCEKLGICWDSPRKGTIQDLEGMNLKEKLTFLKNNRNWKCMVKWEALKEHETTWRMNGLADLKYSILKVESLDSIATATSTTTSTTSSTSTTTTGRATKITVDVKLNGHHWSNEKSGMDFVWEG